MELGRHIILELYECNRTKLNDIDFLRKALQSAAKAMGATVLSANFHPFAPVGISGVVLIKESHLTIHTWPEHDYAAIDIFTCGEMDMQLGVDYLIKHLDASNSSCKVLKRGENIRGLKLL